MLCNSIPLAVSRFLHISLAETLLIGLLLSDNGFRTAEHDAHWSSRSLGVLCGCGRRRSHTAAMVGVGMVVAVTAATTAAASLSLATPVRSSPSPCPPMSVCDTARTIPHFPRRAKPPEENRRGVGRAGREDEGRRKTRAKKSTAGTAYAAHRVPHARHGDTCDGGGFNATSQPTRRRGHRGARIHTATHPTPRSHLTRGMIRHCRTAPDSMAGAPQHSRGRMVGRWGRGGGTSDSFSCVRSGYPRAHTPVAAPPKPRRRPAAAPPPPRRRLAAASPPSRRTPPPPPQPTGHWG